MTVAVRRHGGREWPAGLGPFVADGLGDGLRLVAVARDEWVSGANRFDRPGEAFFLARDGGEPIGMCGLNVDPYLDDPAVARPGFHRLRLRTYDPGAAAFYESLGFDRVAEDAATHAFELGP